MKCKREDKKRLESFPKVDGTRQLFEFFVNNILELLGGRGKSGFKILFCQSPNTSSVMNDGVKMKSRILH